MMGTRVERVHTGCRRVVHENSQPLPEERGYWFGRKMGTRVERVPTLNLRQRLLQVGNEIFGVFQAEGDAHQVVHHADGFAVGHRVIEE